MTEKLKQEMKDKCVCQTCKGIHTVSYHPGACEALAACQACGQLYYSLLYERIGFGREDILEEYQIPITREEFEIIKTVPYEKLELQFLIGREARLLFAGQISKIDSDSALKRCGR